ncbi:MAG: cupin [Phycisphaeraceae bacterium]|nr:cupin [Phycisphaeraceae bacterium]
MSESFSFVANLAEHLQIPEAGILSVTLHESDACRIVLFGFGAGQEMSWHTATDPATIQLVSGRATWSLGTERLEAAPGSWAYMAAHLPHAIAAHEPSVMLLVLHRTRTT